MNAREPVRVLIGSADVGFVRERHDGRWRAWCRPAIAGCSRLPTRERAEHWVRVTFAMLHLCAAWREHARGGDPGSGG